MPWRLLAAVTAAAVIGGAITAQHLLGGPASRPHHPARSLLPVSLAAPAMLHGRPLRPGAAPGTLLFLGGEELRLLQIRNRAPATLAAALPGLGQAADPLGPAPAVQQVISAAGGVIALVTGDGPAGLSDIGNVLFIPVSASGAGTPRIIARANYLALAPDRTDIWVERAGPPWGNGPADSPAWLIDETGHRRSAGIRLHSQVLAAATTGGLLVQGLFGHLALIKAATGAAERTSIPRSAVIAGTDSGQVAWQAASCPAASCPLHVTSIRDGASTVIALPPRLALDSADAGVFDPSGRQFALPLDTVNNRGTATATSVYVADISTGRLVRAPGGPVPLATLPAVSGAIPAGSTDIVSVRWASDSSLWIVATDGLYFQVAYWTGTGPLQVLAPQPGLAYKFDIAGPGPVSRHPRPRGSARPVTRDSPGPPGR